MGDRLSEVPHSGSHVPPRKSSCQSTEGSNKAQSSQTEMRQDTNALADKHHTGTCIVLSKDFQAVL